MCSDSKRQATVAPVAEDVDAGSDRKVLLPFVAFGSKMIHSIRQAGGHNVMPDKCRI